MFRARSSRVAAIGAVAGCLVLQGAIAYAQEDTNWAGAAQRAEIAAPRIEDQISAAEMQDLMLVAEQNDAPLDEVIDRYAWNDNFALAVTEIRDAYPDLFSSAEIVDAQHAWVTFKGIPPERVHAVLDSFAQVAPSVKVELRGGEGYSERELQASIEDVHYAIYDSPGVRDAATSFDADTRTITTSVVLADRPQDSVVASLNATARETLAAVSADKSLGIAAVVDVSDSSVLGGVDSSMGSRLAAGGDSGGPIYWGNTAYGLHQGWKYDPAWPADRDLFSRADRIDNTLGVWIATN